MDKNIKQILIELYELEPALKNNEEQLVLIVQKLLSSKPDTKFDKAFAKRLKSELLGQKQSSNLLNFNIMHKFGYAIGGAALASLLMLPVFINKNLAGTSFVTDTGFNNRNTITLVGEQAFGELGVVTTGGVGSALSALSSYYAPTEESADANAKVAELTRAQAGGGGFAGIAANTSMPAPFPIDDGGYRVATEFRYVYEGEDVDLGVDKLEVLRRVVNPSRVGGLASQFGLGLIDLQKLGQMNFENVSMTGANSDYRVNINLNLGEISLSKDFNGFAEPEAYRALDGSAIPSDEELIRIADSFVTRFGIDLTGYGEPQVAPGFRQSIELSRTNSGYYLPEIVNIIYPLEIRNTKAYDQGANPYGISININLRTKEAMQVYGLTVQQYEASLYPIKTDITELIKYSYGERFYPDGFEIKYVDVKLGTPELVFVQSWTYNEKSGESQLLVPAFKFPVLEKPEGHPYYPDSIIISLVDEFSGRGDIRIMEATPGSAPSMGVTNSVGAPDAISPPEPVGELQIEN